MRYEIVKSLKSVNGKVIVYSGLLFFVLFGFQNCDNLMSGDAEQGEKVNLQVSEEIQEKATFSWLSANVFTPICLECHNGAMAFSGLQFNTYENVMESVVPGYPEQSILYKRSFTTQFFKLNEAEILAIRTWIAQGAKNN